ncbi:MAG: KH domain-containing protein [Clostridia bacterium]|nr:KH domain-containing protein [Clostridia bacterium]
MGICIRVKTKRAHRSTSLRATDSTLDIEQATRLWLSTALILRDREDGSLTEIFVNIICEKESHKGIIIGKQGTMLKKIATEARSEIENLLGRKVYLECRVKVREDWRNNENLINEYNEF